MTGPVLVVASLLAATAPAPVDGASASPAPAAPASARSARSEAPGPGKKLGIRIKALRLTAGGYMVDVRYRVMDRARAKTFLARKDAELFLVDEATGRRFAVPTTSKLGALRQRPGGEVRTDRDYFVLFANPGRHLRAGDKVTLVAGEVKVAHLALE
jgi:hypothetical protein